MSAGAHHGEDAAGGEPEAAGKDAAGGEPVSGGERPAATARTGYVQVYTGDGKGKTTAGFGLAMRAAGRGLRVLILQFMKADPTWGEIVSAGRLGIPVEQVGLDHWVRVGKLSPDDLRAAAAGFARARDLVVSGAYDLVVLDELVTALYFELVPVADVLALLAAKPAHTELLLTGRRAPDEIVAAADLVSEMRPVKHYFDAGVKAREGIEY
jgi:cob(I)alamin adenosyltransferase